MILFLGGGQMTEKETNVLNRVPKIYRKHIVCLEINKSGCFDSRGKELNNYCVTWDNGDVHTFQNIKMMLYMIKEYSINGYYVEP